MRPVGALIGASLAWLVLAAPAPAAPLDDVVTAAKKEGTIEFYGPATLTPKGAQDLVTAFNRKYGLNVTLNYYPSANMVRDTAKVVAEGASGVPPEWDLMVVTDAQHATLALRKMHQTFNYRALGVDPKLIEFGGGSVSFANQYVLPAYNKNLLPAKDVPRSWEDLLDPKWKGGKLGVSVATHHFARLAVGAWGEEKGTRYVKALAEQKPALGNPGEISVKLQLGEILVYVNQIDSFIHEARKTGAPLVFAEGIEPIVSPSYHAGVPKGARHPNVAHLFAAFLPTPEAQELWEKYAGQSSPFVPGTTMYKFAQGRKMLYLKGEHAELVDRLAREYAKTLGFR